MIDELRSRQYIITESDWQILVLEMKANASFYERRGITHMYEEFMYGGEPIHHLDTGPKKVRCLRVQDGEPIEGYHWRGHCPALILKEAEVTPMAKVEGKKREQVTAGLAPKKHVADEASTKSKSAAKKKDPRPCSCDCGDMTGGGYFAIGHDSKLKSLFLKVAKGEVLKKSLTKKQAAMFALYEKDKSVRIKDIAKEVWG
jgi:hypothetical protein